MDQRLEDGDRDRAGLPGGKGSIQISTGEDDGEYGGEPSTTITSSVGGVVGGMEATRGVRLPSTSSNSSWRVLTAVTTSQTRCLNELSISSGLEKKH